ncbi:MAG: hypothetical protein AAFV88_21060 [Planctomycetota bacterium]
MSKKIRPGRPRKNPEKLATWKPPPDWVRVVAWVSPNERKALKKFAIDADTSVANLIRSLASALEHGVIEAEELIKQYKRGAAVMEKIPTIFERGPDFKVTDQIREGCEWVFAGEGLATEKLDGTNVRLTIRAGQCVRLEKRRNPSKKQKAQGIKDGWYVDADEFGKEDKWIFEAMQNTDLSEWPDGEHSAEALGPRIQGNPLGLEQHLCVPFNLVIPTFDELDRSFDGLKQALNELESKYSPENLAEGIVFHHPDGRRAKIKRKDFAA